MKKINHVVCINRIKRYIISSRINRPDDELCQIIKVRCSRVPSMRSYYDTNYFNIALDELIAEGLFMKDGGRIYSPLARL